MGLNTCAYSRRSMMMVVWLSLFGMLVGYASSAGAQEAFEYPAPTEGTYTDAAGQTHRVRVLKDVGDERIIMDPEGEVKSLSKHEVHIDEHVDVPRLPPVHHAERADEWGRMSEKREHIDGMPTPVTIEARRQMYNKGRLPGFGRMVAGSTLLMGLSIVAFPALMPLVLDRDVDPFLRAFAGVLYLAPASLATTLLVSGVAKMRRTQQRIENDTVWDPDLDRWLDKEGRALRTSGTIVMLVSAGLLYSSLMFGVDAERGRFTGKPLRLSIAGAVTLGAGATMVGFANRQRRARHADFTRQMQWALAPGIQRGGGHLTLVMNF